MRTADLHHTHVLLQDDSEATEQLLDLLHSTGYVTRQEEGVSTGTWRGISWKAERTDFLSCDHDESDDSSSDDSSESYDL
jgi:hypothetical protein